MQKNKLCLSIGQRKMTKEESLKELTCGGQVEGTDTFQQMIQKA